jgi:hypothetical protein
VGEIPHEKALVERFQGQPFAILGVNTDADKNEYRKKILEHGITWNSIFAGSPDSEIPNSWGIMGYPTTFLFDVNGVLRHRDLRGDDVAPAVAALLAEAADNSGQE